MNTKVSIPDELTAALARNKAAQTAWESLPPSHQREHAKYVAEAKQTETRERRAAKTVETLAAAG